MSPQPAAATRRMRPAQWRARLAGTPGTIHGQIQSIVQRLPSPADPAPLMAAVAAAAVAESPHSLVRFAGRPARTRDASKRAKGASCWTHPWHVTCQLCYVSHPTCSRALHCRSSLTTVHSTFTPAFALSVPRSPRLPAVPVDNLRIHASPHPTPTKHCFPVIAPSASMHQCMWREMTSFSSIP